MMSKKVKLNVLSYLLVFVFIIPACTNLTEKKVKKAPIIPLEDFFKNPEKTSYKISPDGKYFSYKTPWENRQNIFIQEIGTDTSVRITSETERDIPAYFWANNTRILYLKDTGGDENYMLYGVDIDGSNFKALTEFEGVKTQIIDDLFPQIKLNHVKSLPIINKIKGCNISMSKKEKLKT